MTGRGKRLRSAVVCALLAGGGLAGCTQEPVPEGRTERETADAYVRALNGRDAAALAELGPPGYVEVEADAREAVAEDGGKGITVADVEVSHEFGDDLASVRVTGEERDGRPFARYVSMFRRDGTWVVLLGHAPGAGTKGGASPASTERP
ncbi:hypothetical protein [Streptomyces sp. NRRL F-5727]|uniref:hypothetical protein n=1 Tax=Streptomyces sp. NRRL F-5727 TaxID=1463871 RepID=UPI0004CA3F07|nr:hypothetical protein [Streptomyces sp. NRRL F-5727]